LQNIIGADKPLPLIDLQKLLLNHGCYFRVNYAGVSMLEVPMDLTKTKTDQKEFEQYHENY